MAFADLEKIYLSLGSKSGESIESACDQSNELDGSFFSDDFTINEVDYAGQALREQSVYHIATQSKTLSSFQKLFGKEMSMNNLSLFKNFDIKNALSLLSSTDSVTLTLPVHKTDSSLDANQYGVPRDVLNYDEVNLIFSQAGILKSIQADPTQSTASGDGYMWLDVTLQNPPSPLQLKALYTLKTRMEELAGSDVETDVVRFHGVDWGTIYAIAKAQLTKFQSTLEATRSESPFSTTLNPNFMGQKGLSAERFDAYAENTKIPTILGSNEYMRLLSWDNGEEKRFVEYKRLAQYAGMDGEDLSFGWQTFMGIDATDRAEFQNALLHFRDSVVQCRYSVESNGNSFAVEAYYDPDARYLDILIQRDGEHGRIESTTKGAQKFNQLSISGDVEFSEEEIFLILIQLRSHLLEQKKQGIDAISDFDEQILIGY